MPSSDEDIWRPQERHLINAHVLALARRLGFSDFDSLYAYSLAHPAEFWQGVIDYSQFRWSRKPAAYVDLSRGPEFAEWFPGGEINWVDTFLAWSVHPETRDRPGIITEREDGSRIVLSFAKAARLTRRFAAGLRARGIGRGDRVGLLIENGFEATVSFLALSYLGCIVVPLFSGFGSEAIVARLRQCRARALIATTGFNRRGRPVDMAAVVRDALERLDSISLVIWKSNERQPAPASELTWDQVAAAAEDEGAAERMSSNDPFMVMYTSGTTGLPKGIVHTHSGFPLKIIHDALVHWDIGPGDVFFWPVDMGWVAGPISLCAALLRGATLVCCDGAPDFPDWSRMSRIIERNRVTHFGAAPTLIRGLAANQPLSLAGSRSTVRLLLTAGEGIDADHFNWFRRNFAQPDSPLINSSGGTEASSAFLASVVAKPIRPVKFNTATPGIAVTVVDSNGTPVVNQQGELAVAGPFVGMTKSFWEDDARYLDTYWKTVPGMWIHGDLAIKTVDGEYLLLGRSDDTLKLAGKRVGPAEIEQVVLELDQVQEAAAVGINDPVKGQRLAIFVVLVPAAKAADHGDIEKEIVRRMDLRLGKVFRPSHVYVVKQLPKTRTSKIMRRLIRQICSHEPLGDLSSLDDPTALDEIRSAVGAAQVAK